MTQRDEQNTTALNSYIQGQIDYAENHADAGDVYAHLPRESWTQTDTENLLNWMKESEIDGGDIEPDDLADMALENFTMESGSIYGSDANPRAFCCGAFPIQEHEIYITFDGVDTKPTATEFNAVRNSLDLAASLADVATDADGAYVYSSTDAAWFAELDPETFKQAIADALTT